MTLIVFIAVDKHALSDPSICSFLGQPDAERLANDFSFRRGPRRD